jgi:hypothetical protein
MEYHVQTERLPWVCLSVNMSNLREVLWVRSFASRDSVVGVETRLPAGRSGVRITIGARGLSSPNRPPRVWGPPNLSFSGYQDYFWALGGRGVILITHLHLARRIRISGGVPLLLMHAFIALTGTTAHVSFNFRINAVVSVCTTCLNVLYLGTCPHLHLCI